MIKPISSPPVQPASPEAARDEKRLKEACKEFESVLTGFLLKSMRESVVKAEESDQARSTFEGMMDETLSKELSHNSGIGLGDVLYRELAPLLKSKTAEARPLSRPVQQNIQSAEETTRAELAVTDDDRIKRLNE